MNFLWVLDDNLSIVSKNGKEEEGHKFVKLLLFVSLVNLMLQQDM